jgi:hypothetical protein
MDTEHALSAAILLLMVCAAFPPDAANTASLRDALALLASMGHRGNHHIGARCQVLHQLAADFVPGLLVPGSGSDSETGLGGGGAVSAAAAAAAVGPRADGGDGGSGPSDEPALDAFWDEFVVGGDGIAGSFGPAAPSFDPVSWDCVIDDMMQE